MIFIVDAKIVKCDSYCGMKEIVFSNICKLGIREKIFLEWGFDQSTQQELFVFFFLSCSGTLDNALTEIYRY